jgi:predicted RNase H-like nuclease (RuvC/YqgF family)
MRPDKRVVYLDCAATEASAKIYNLDVRQTASRRPRRVRELEHENTLLARALREIQAEIARLRKQLGGPRR